MVFIFALKVFKEVLHLYSNAKRHAPMAHHGSEDVLPKNLNTTLKRDKEVDEALPLKET